MFTSFYMDIFNGIFLLPPWRCKYIQVHANVLKIVSSLDSISVVHKNFTQKNTNNSVNNSIIWYIKF